MAKFNEIQVGRFNRFVQKLLAIKGPPPLSTVSADLVFMHPFFAGDENRYLQGWDQYAAAVSVTGLAANQSAFQLRNPLGSNVIAVVTRALFSEGAADFANLITVRGATTDQLTATTAIQSFDGRGRKSCTMIASYNPGQAFTSPGGSQNVAFNQLSQTNVVLEMMRFGDEITLVPGDAILARSNSNAVTAQIGFWWRERYLEDAERF